MKDSSQGPYDPKLTPSERLFRFVGYAPALVGLEAILKAVANGELSQDDAARRIRRLALTPYVPPWISVLLKASGGLFLIVGLVLAAYAGIFAIGAKEVQGTVVAMAGESMQSAIVEYEVGGQRFKLHSSISTSPSAYSVGQKVPILYRPENPGRAQINSFANRWLLPVIFLASGFWAIVLGFFFPKPKT